MSQRPIPEHLRRQVEEAIRTGAPLPPGVVAVGPGQGPPPGAIPLGDMSNNKHPAMVKKAESNPIPEGDAGYKVIRESNECNIPIESKNLNTLMDKLLGAPHEDEEALEEIVRDSLAKGVVVALNTDKYCKAHSSHRVAISFAAHPELEELHKSVQDLQQRAVDAHNVLLKLVEEGKNALQKRWETAVKLGGLSPENNYYSINEDAGCIEQVELKCHECKGAVKIRKARQALQDFTQKSKAAPAPSEE